MPVKLVVITDTHFDYTAADSPKRGDIAHLLLAQAVNQINRQLKPDFALFGGDLLNDPDPDQIKTRYPFMRAVLEKLECPWLAIPGNHDADTNLFYQYLPRPKPITDIKGLRLVTCIDEQTPDFCAIRSEDDLALLDQARNKFTGPIALLHHVPCFTPSQVDCPFNLTNAKQVIDKMKAADVSLVISGHFHPGFDFHDDSFRSLCCPALCEPPFPITEILIDDTDNTDNTDNHNIRAFTLPLINEINL